MPLIEQNLILDKTVKSNGSFEIPTDKKKFRNTSKEISSWDYGACFYHPKRGGRGTEVEIPLLFSKMKNINETKRKLKERERELHIYFICMDTFISSPPPSFALLKKLFIVHSKAIHVHVGDR